MAEQNKLEVWLRGPVTGIGSLLQPAAHALLQAREELNALMADFPDDLLWLNPAGMASAGFHLQHLSGVLDRLFTYANSKQLSPPQLEYLSHESKPLSPFPGTKQLVARFNKQVDLALEQLAATPEQSLTEARGVGRQQLPSTVMGLLFHAAEHTQRHFGQLLVTVRFLRHQHGL